MPPFEMITKDFLRELYKENKDLLKVNQVDMITVPRYDEISVSSLYEECIKLQHMAQFFPDVYPKGRQCNRDYFFSILATVQPEYCQQLIRSCKDKRFTINTEEDKGKAIEITAEWAAQLKQFP